MTPSTWEACLFVKWVIDLFGARLSPGVIVEHVDKEVFVLIPGHPTVLRLTGDMARFVSAVNERSKLPEVRSQDVAELVELGVLAPDPTRRGFLKAGAIGAGAGLSTVVLSLPAAATSSSQQAVNSTRFTQRLLGSGTANPITLIDIQLSENGVLVQIATIPEGTAAQLILDNGTSLNGTFREDGNLFRFEGINVPRADFDGKTHLLRFQLVGVTYQVVIVGP